MSCYHSPGSVCRNHWHDIRPRKTRALWQGSSLALVFLDECHASGFSGATGR